MLLDNIADEIFKELGSPTSLSVPAIAYWLQRNLGELNTKLETCFTINEGTGEVSPDLSIEEKAIFKKMYGIYFYSNEIRRNLSAAALDPVVEISSDGSRVRKISRNEVVKSYIQIRSQEEKELGDSIFMYKKNKSFPRQNVGDDVVSNNYWEFDDYNRV